MRCVLAGGALWLAMRGESGQLPNASPLVVVIGRWIYLVGGQWKGTAGELLERLRELAYRQGIRLGCPCPTAA